MSISDAYMRVECDGPGCQDSEDVPLAVLGARGRSWDDRYVKSHMERLGWTMADDRDGALCPECKKQEEP